MSIRIDQKKCTGCGHCRQVCPGNLLQADGMGKTKIRCPQDCWGCTSCLKECSFGAIGYYLGADIGGKGTTLYTRQEGNYLHWVFVKPDGREEVITINRQESNQY
ncbi:ferredoxin family protein [Bacillota bacterium LX-D]|nr:ferredoxin family protein [Bacillota bacterium LX-D]